MVVTLWARLPLLEPPFVLSNGKSWPSYGPTLVQLKSDVMKLTYYIRDQHLAHMVVTLWARLPLLEPTLVL